MCIFEYRERKIERKNRAREKEVIIINIILSSRARGKEVIIIHNVDTKPTYRSITDGSWEVLLSP